MEVHHHPNVEKKTFKEYFLEFLMIFLAVTMGFFAESLREHISNNEKEAGYIKSLLVDLKADTVEINNFFTRYSVRVSNYKSLLGYLEKPTSSDTLYLLNFYTAARYTLDMDEAQLTDRTTIQLKNSDNSRLIKNSEIVTAIIDYSNGIANCKTQLNVVDKFTIDSETFARQVINLKTYSLRFFQSNQYDDSIIPIPLISTESNTLQQYSNAIYMKLAVEANYLRMTVMHQKLANNLITLLKKEYNFN
jgi:hypothetical protein